MQQMKYLIALCGILVLSSCAKPEPDVAVSTEIVKPDITIMKKPKPVNLVAPRFYVVNEDNYQEFISEFFVKNGTKTIVAMSVKDYENMSLNIAELRRYIQQQNEIIVYYEDALAD